MRSPNGVACGVVRGRGDGGGRPLAAGLESPNPIQHTLIRSYFLNTFNLRPQVDHHPRADYRFLLAVHSGRDDQAHTIRDSLARVALPEPRKCSSNKCFLVACLRAGTHPKSTSARRRKYLSTYPWDSYRTVLCCQHPPPSILPARRQSPAAKVRSAAIAG